MSGVAKSLTLAMLHGLIHWRRERPNVDEIVCQLGDEPRPLAARPPTADEWFAQLEEHFPRAYLHAYASDLDQLRVCSGCTPREAAAYARAYLLGPRIVTTDEERQAGIGHYAPPTLPA